MSKEDIKDNGRRFKIKIIDQIRYNPSDFSVGGFGDTCGHLL